MTTPDPTLDMKFVRARFPAFAEQSLEGWRFFENAGGSYPCAPTVDALTGYYARTKVQPYAPYPAAEAAGAQMDRSQARWAEALGVGVDEIHFGPSTSQNTYVLANAFRKMLPDGAEVVVTNQDHEANTGVWRRMAEERGLTLREWRVDAQTGMLDLADLEALLTDTTALVCFPHCSNIVGYENDAAAIVAKAKTVGAWTVVDGVSAAPHGFPDVGAMGADAYLFSLYKTFSVHQGLMVARRGLIDALPNEGHYFNVDYPDKRLTPAGPDHAQIASAGAVLDYVEATAVHHGVGGNDLRTQTAAVSALWRAQENAVLPPLLAFLRVDPRVRLLGPSEASDGRRAPTVAFSPTRDPEEVAAALAEHKVMAGAGHFYAARCLEGQGIDPARGVVRVSYTHYTDADDVAALIAALDAVL